MSGITEEHRCGYCLGSFEWMIDPRTLNCGHSFCLTCLKGDLQMYKRIECPACKVTVTDVDVESLPTAHLDEGSSEATRESEHVPCDRCVAADKKESKAEFFCETCNSKFCVEHDKMHEGFFGNQHPKRSVASYLEAPDKYEVAYCSVHGNKEISVGCEKCLKVLCADCDLVADVCTATGKAPHTYMTFSVMKERLHKEYDKALRNLGKKSQAICKLEKQAWRRLDKVTEHAEDMLKEVDRATDEQIAAIRENADLLKVKIKSYIAKCTEQTEVYTGQILADLRKVDDLRTEIHSAVKKSSPLQLVKDSQDRTGRITEVMKMEPEKPLLEQKVLYKKGENRNIEVDTRSHTPTSVDYHTSVTSDSQLNSTSHLSDTEVAAGTSTSIQIRNPNTNAVTGSINCPGLVKVSSSNQKVYALVNADGKQMVKSYTADLQTSECIVTIESSTFSDLTTTKEFIILVDNVNHSLSVYSFNGEQKVDISLAELNEVTVSSICSLDDDHVLVAAGNRMYCYALGGDNSSVWTSVVLEGLCCICCEPTTGYIWAVAGRAFHLFSPDGRKIRQFDAKPGIGHLFGCSYYFHSWDVFGMSASGKTICVVANVTVADSWSRRNKHIVLCTYRLGM